MAFTNCYEDIVRAEAYSQLEFANTYYLAPHGRGAAGICCVFSRVKFPLTLNA